MKRRILAILLICVLLATVIPFSAIAVASEPDDVIYFEDGSYIEIYLEESLSRANGSKTGSETLVHRDPDGSENWRAVLTGSFTYYNGTATCTNASCSVSISDSTWSVGSKNVTRYYNTAQADLTMKLKSLGVTTNHYYTIYLECDADGNLS